VPGLRVATWNVAGARLGGGGPVDLAAAVAGVRALDADVIALQEVDRELARSGRQDQPLVVAEALAGTPGGEWSWSFAPALVGDDLRPLTGPDPGGPAYGNVLLSRLPLEAVEHLRFPTAGGGEQRTALVGTVRVGSRPVTVAAAHLSNRQGYNARQLRVLQGAMAGRAAPRVLAGDLNLPSLVLVSTSRRGWPESVRGATFPSSRPAQQLDHVLRNDPAAVLRVRGGRVVAGPVSDHRALVAVLEVAP
jgi:endonuclease/exonuclease/phosphatase family metal-dependent hydrolase